MKNHQNLNEKHHPSNLILKAPDQNTDPKQHPKYVFWDQKTDDWPAATTEILLQDVECFSTQSEQFQPEAPKDTTVTITQ